MFQSDTAFWVIGRRGKDGLIEWEEEKQERLKSGASQTALRSDWLLVICIYSVWVFLLNSRVFSIYMICLATCLNNEYNKLEGLVENQSAAHLLVVYMEVLLYTSDFISETLIVKLYCNNQTE